MLLNFFASRTQTDNNLPPISTFTGKPLILQIIHAGGLVERYYMAFPASWIIDKYPNFVLARPEIFQHPWDAIVQPHEILVPGQKYFVVPIRTVKKLRRKILKPTIQPVSNGLISQDKDTAFLLGKPKPCIRHVCFKGIDQSNTRNDSGVAQGSMKKCSNAKGLRKKSVHFTPSLTIIHETQGFQD